jgi:hypothetical protein
MDIGKSLSFVPEDENWLSKIGIGAVISAIPVLNFAWNGYLVDLMRNTANYDPRPLPEWDDLGGQFTRGLLVSIAMLIYSLPALLVVCLALGTMIGPALLSGEEIADELAAASGGLIVLATCCMCVYVLALTFFLPAVFINYARRGTFASTFHLGEIFHIITANLGDYLAAWAVTLGISFVIGIVISGLSTLVGWIPCVGWIAAVVVGAVAQAWGSAIFAHLFGQVGSQIPEFGSPSP